MELVLYTERLTLRPLQPEDVDLALEMFTDPQVVRYVSVPTTPEEIQSEMTHNVKRCGGGCIGIWCVLDRVTSEKLGTCILLPMPIEEDDTNWDLVEGPDIPGCRNRSWLYSQKISLGKGLCHRDLQTVTGICV